MKLHERFGDKGYHTCIATTFGIDFDAYEGVALPRLRGAGCNNNLVLMDARMMTHTLETSSVLPSHAGRHYTLSGIGAPNGGVFHSKILLQLGRNSGRLIVGSANLTAPGLGGNLEVVGAVSWSAGDSDFASARIIASAWQYVSGLIDTSQEAIAYQMGWTRRRTGWLFDTAPADSALALPGGDAVAFLTNVGAAGIGDQFIALLDSQPVTRLISISPYWDADLAALRHLAMRLSPAEVAILLGGNQATVPVGALDGVDSVSVFGLGAFADHRFAHAKVLIAQTEDADHVLFGSANCTVAAMGKAGFRGINEEACLYRRLASGAAITALGLGSAFDQRIDRNSLPPYVLAPEIPLDGAAQRYPGRFEAFEDRLLWWPSAGYSRMESWAVELLDFAGVVLQCELTLLSKGEDGCFRFLIVGSGENASFARVRGDGRVSAPAVVVVVDAIRHVVREARGRASERVAEQLAAETEEGLWLLEAFDVLAASETEDPEIETDAAEVARRHAKTPGKVPELPSRTLSYEDFIAGRRLRSDIPSNGKSDFSGSELALVQHFLNRLIGADKRSGPGDAAADDESIRLALRMSDQADEADEDSSDAKRPEARNPILDAAKKAAEAYKAVAVRNVATREKIVSAVMKFNENVLTKAEKSSFSHRDILRLRVILMVVLAAARPVGDPSEHTLRSIQVLNSKGEKCWPLLFGKLLATFFSGKNPALRHLRIDQRHDGLPIEILECWALCLWVSNSCEIALQAIPRERQLLSSIQGLTQRIYLATMLDREHFLGEQFMRIYDGLSKRFAVNLILDLDGLREAHSRAVDLCEKVRAQP